MPDPKPRRSTRSTRRRDEPEYSDTGPAVDAPEPTEADGLQPAADTGPADGEPDPDGEHSVTGKPRQYLIAARGAVNRIGPADFDPQAAGVNANILAALEAGAGTVLATLEGPQSLAVAGAGPPAQDLIFVAEMDDQQAHNLRRNFSTAIVAEDVPVEMAPATLAPDPGLLPIMPLEDAVHVSVVVRADGQALAGANAYLMGSVFPAQGVADEDGRVEFTIYGERLDTIKALYVKPRGDYWSLWLPRPSLVEGRDNVVELHPLGVQYPGFPDEQVWGWGQTAMGLDRLDGDLTGAGVRVAVVDSGVQADHPNLSVDDGRDLVTGNAWGTDGVGHGTHCAGVICARDTGSGVRGFAPDAELIAVKIFPGAQVSHLVEALNFCIEAEVDVVNMSLGVPALDPPQIELLQGKLRQARAAGVACIVAAGNSAGPVQYPGAFAEVLTVAAVGRQGTFPDDSYHGTQVSGPAPGRDAFFPAKFTCFGPEVDVAAPGVAVLSTFAPTGYSAMDGTSMAAPHVAGLAALLVGHHRDLRDAPRDGARVDRLFQIITSGARRLPFPASDDLRQGSGLPTVDRALATRSTNEVRTSPAEATATATGRETRPDLSDEFPMFKGITPGRTGTVDLRSLQAELDDLAQLEDQLASRGEPTLAGHGGRPSSPELQQLDDTMRDHGIAIPSGTGPNRPRRDVRLDKLDRALAAAGLATAPVSVQDMATPTAEHSAELQFLDTFLQDPVEDLIQQLRRYAHQYSGVRDCVPLIDRTVRLFGAHDYPGALATGYQALTCIRSKLGG
ncbi:S8 family serine peptidase [Pseudonocardia tropica]|uniref:S8 family serine peptidase n=1 Tax=Pseudonocardia tropica TaxID=681289 RepID=A0ABV1K5E5_9PSEU